MNLALSALHVAAVIIAVGLMISSTACSSRSAPRMRLLAGVQRLETTSVVMIPLSIAVAPTCHVAGPDDTTMDAACGRLRLAVGGEGHQHYAFNGTDWALFNATADLFHLTPTALNITPIIDDDKEYNASTSAINTSSCSDAQQLLLQHDHHRQHIDDQHQVIGQHFFLAHPDAAGGQPSWRITLNSTARIPREETDDHTSSVLVTAKILQAVSVDPNSITWSLFQTTTRSGSLDSLGAITYVQRIATHGGLPPSTISNASIGDIYLSPYSTIYAFYIPASS